MEWNAGAAGHKACGNDALAQQQDLEMEAQDTELQQWVEIQSMNKSQSLRMQWRSASKGTCIARGQGPEPITWPHKPHGRNDEI